MKRGIALVALWAATALSQPYDYLPFRMISTQQNPWPYYVDTRVSNPAGLAVNSMRAAADQAWQTWNNVTCASPKVLAKGASTGVVARVPDPYDTFSVTPVWLTSTQDNDFSFIFGSGFVASVSLPVSWAGVLQTCDTYFNGANLQWSTDSVTPRNMYDVETVMLHEAGHCLGLNHLGGGDIMYFSVEPAKNQHTLGNGDVGALCERNPAANQVGAPCGVGDACGNGLTCVLQPTQNGAQHKLCTSGCTLGSNGGCPLPMTCQASTAISGFTGACQLPGTAVTQVGRPCTTNPGCGSSVSVCRMPEAAPSGGVFWANGYCSQSCKPGQPMCPAGSACLQFAPDDYACLQSCRVGLADCRPEYACVATSDTSGVCAPRCYADRDCADTTRFFCRICDGLCVSRNNVTGQIGDGCANDEQCGQGQICRAVLPGSVKTCTQQCARGCGVCPQGSSCTPLAGGDLFCIRDCTGPGTCPAGLRCADTANGKGCVPACANDLECAVGQHCYMGECYSPNDDAGCGALCAPVDAGKPIVVLPKDAGTGPGGSGGCGCTSADLTASWLMLVCVGLLFASRRQAWPGQ